MRNLIILIVLLGSAPKLTSQNLVNNPSFENYNACPTGTSQLNALNWFVTPNSGNASPDFYNTCASGSSVGVPDNVVGSQSAYNGNGYAGIYCYYLSSPHREYLQSSLSAPLTMGQTYYVSFRASLGDSYGIAIGSLGAHFSNTQISGNGSVAPINVSPQIISSSIISSSTNWTQVSGSFVANGGENYITIGNFSSDAATPHTINDDVMISDMSYYFIDMVVVSTNPLTTNESEDRTAAIFPNPFQDVVTVEYENKDSDDVIRIHAINGQLLKEITGAVDTINLSELAKGVYFLTIVTQNSNTLVKKIVKI